MPKDEAIVQYTKLVFGLYGLVILTLIYLHSI